MDSSKVRRHPKRTVQQPQATAIQSSGGTSPRSMHSAAKASPRQVQGSNPLPASPRGSTMNVSLAYARVSTEDRLPQIQQTPYYGRKKASRGFYDAESGGVSCLNPPTREIHLQRQEK
uniref:Uncharacterized protein n=1 Tax=Eutreptiella gymnastica TaxID=73025 RepID=A0A7S4LLZ4_9EUGL